MKVKAIYIVLNRALSDQLYYIDYVRNRTQSKLKINIVEHMVNTSIDLKRILRINFKRQLLFQQKIIEYQCIIIFKIISIARFLYKKIKKPSKYKININEVNYF